jgi:hypothetical protein
VNENIGLAIAREIELILQLIGKTVPQSLSAKTEDFYDSRFFTELRESGFLKRLWGEKL